MPKVSIIVPVFNSEKTLTACLSNLLFQTLKDIEIIIVNDNSTDNSIQIINDSKSQFSDKVKVINLTKNHGAGGARNYGIKEATGEYIGFVDSDDIVDPTMFEKLYIKALKHDYDIVDSGFFNEEKNNAIIYTSDDLTGILDNHKRSILIASGGYIWSRIFKTSLIKDSTFLFRENCILEDSDWLINSFFMANSIGNVKEILYLYKNYENSASKYKNPEFYYQSCIDAVSAIYEKTLNYSDYKDELLNAVEYAMTQLISFALNLSLSQKDSTSFDFNEKIKLLKKLYKKYITVPVLENTFIIKKIPKEDLDILINYLSN